MILFTILINISCMILIIILLDLLIVFYLEGGESCPKVRIVLNTKGFI